MKDTRTISINARDRWGGCAEVVDMAPNGSWVTIEVVTPRRDKDGYRKARFTINLFDAASIARRVHEAVKRHADHQRRLESIVRGEGY